jgi:hypothetical protein
MRQLSEDFGIAGQIAKAYHWSTPDDATLETKLRAAWEKINERRDDIVSFIDNKVTPHGTRTLPSLNELQSMADGANSINYNAVKVVFTDGSGVTMRNPHGSRKDAIDDVYPVRTHCFPTP